MAGHLGLTASTQPFGGAFCAFSTDPEAHNLSASPQALAHPQAPRPTLPMPLSMAPGFSPASGFCGTMSLPQGLPMPMPVPMLAVPPMMRMPAGVHALSVRPELKVPEYDDESRAFVNALGQTLPAVRLPDAMRISDLPGTSVAIEPNELMPGGRVFPATVGYTMFNSTNFHGFKDAARWVTLAPHERFFLATQADPRDFKTLEIENRRDARWPRRLQVDFDTKHDQLLLLRESVGPVARADLSHVMR